MTYMTLETQKISSCFNSLSRITINIYTRKSNQCAMNTSFSNKFTLLTILIYLCLSYKLFHWDYQTPNSQTWFLNPKTPLLLNRLPQLCQESIKKSYGIKSISVRPLRHLSPCGQKLGISIAILSPTFIQLLSIDLRQQMEKFSHCVWGPQEMHEYYHHSLLRKLFSPSTWGL